jgi:hypothetical protein
VASRADLSDQRLGTTTPSCLVLELVVVSNFLRPYYVGQVGWVPKLRFARHVRNISESPQSTA